ncbi:DUF975 family protein [Enterococcus hulanensis]|uniref:DUF975 family protein n=1 Tax=Enterococcus TaxID=1350 RepID=UPI000B5A9EBE|nr:MULTISPECIES: DUF975 family protein [Enterococcus]MBO0412227.1 DUF975 family protein [Enterococcus hulanensis]MBO0456039.1 DUF975 family protein [Enterococcus hulanensis]OTO20432.1 hypothetical protein A5875_001785 [Enterococcus sp. 3H8_DIV0648]
MSLSEYRQRAKDRLNGQWGINVGLIVVVGLLTGMINTISSMPNNENLQLGISFLLGIFVVFAFSYALYYISLYVVRGGRAELGQIFVVFQQGYYVPLLLINIIAQVVQYVLAAIFFIPLLLQAGSSVYISLISSGGVTSAQNASTLLNIGVLGLYAILTLAFLLVSTIISIIFKFAVWVKFDYPDLSVGDCIKRAWSLLKDRWGKYILLQLSFIGWYILGFVALFVGLLFVAVYVNTASAAFYDQALKEKIDQGELA